MCLQTCNRAEFIFTAHHFVCPGITSQLLRRVNAELDEVTAAAIAVKAEVFQGADAIEHLLRVSSSLDSVVIGEQEIITQIRKAFEEASDAQLAGDALRLVINQCIKTAKEIFTQTDLSRKPVSVVSLAWREFEKAGLKHDARILLIGAGQVIRNFLKFLHEHEYRNFTVANRTLAHAQSLANAFGGSSIPLDELENYDKGFDALISCTASGKAIITVAVYDKLLKGETGKKFIIDLALPADVERKIISHFPVHYTGMKQIQEVAAQNIHFRKQALNECEPIIAKAIKDFGRIVQERNIELLMRSIPHTIREIKATALGEIFAKDLQQLDESSRGLLEKIMTYMEKKYISIPMKMAKEVLLDAVAKN